MNRLFYTLQNPAPRFVVADNKMVAGQDERAGLICPDKTRLQTPLNVMNDDILRSIYSVCPEVSDISGKRRFHFFGCGLFIVSRSEGRNWRSFHNLYHHMSCVIVDQVSFRIFSVRIRPFAIWIVFILSVFERHAFPGADQLLLHSVGKQTRRRRLFLRIVGHASNETEISYGYRKR